MIGGNYKCRPHDVLGAVSVYVLGSPRGVTCLDVSKKFNILPNRAGMLLGILWRRGVVERRAVARRNFGAKAIYYPTNSVLRVFATNSSEDYPETSSEDLLKHGRPSSSSSSSSESDSESDILYTKLETRIRRTSEENVLESDQI